ncbi:MAG: hypothetical protein ACSLFN_03930 [Candidatus Limnocylindrales bacterium]
MRRRPRSFAGTSPARRLVLVGLVVGVVGTACGSPDRTQTPRPVPSTTDAATARPSFDPAEIARWIAFRTAYGLRADLDWLLAVASDPEAVTDLPAPLMPDEVLQMASQAKAAGQTVQVLKRYGASVPDDFAGAFIDGPLAVARFTRRIAEHQRALDAILGPDGPFEVRLTKYSIVELEVHRRTVQADAAWFETIGTRLSTTEVSILTDTVQVRYLGPNDGQRGPSEAAQNAILDHFGRPDWMALRWDGPLPWAGEWGRLDVTVVDRAGKPLRGISCHADPRINEAQEGDAILEADRRGECVFLGLPAVTYDLTIERDGLVIGRSDRPIEVRADETLRIVIEAGP